MDELKQGQLVDVVIDVDANDEVQRSIPSVDDLVLSVLQEGTLILSSGEALADKLSF